MESNTKTKFRGRGWKTKKTQFVFSFLVNFNLFKVFRIFFQNSFSCKNSFPPISIFLSTNEYSKADLCRWKNMEQTSQTYS